MLLSCYHGVYLYILISSAIIGFFGSRGRMSKRIIDNLELELDVLKGRFDMLQGLLKIL